MEFVNEETFYANKEIMGDAYKKLLMIYFKICTRSCILPVYSSFCIIMNINAIDLHEKGSILALDPNIDKEYITRKMRKRYRWWLKECMYCTSEELRILAQRDVNIQFCKEQIYGSNLSNYKNKKL